MGKKTLKKEASSSSDSSDVIIPNAKSGVKRRREDSSDEAEKSQVAVTPSRPRSAKRKRQSSPFRRVRTEEIELFTCKDGKQLDNRMAVDVVGGVVGWGKKAHEQLKTVKGKKFTQEKKRKLLRGSDQYVCELNQIRRRHLVATYAGR